MLGTGKRNYVRSERDTVICEEKTSTRVHQRADMHRGVQVELKNRIYKWLDEIEEPKDIDADSFSDGNSSDMFSEDEALNASILYHPDFAEWALVEDLKRQIELENEGTINLLGVFDQAQSSLSRFVREKFRSSELR